MSAESETEGEEDSGPDHKLDDPEYLEEQYHEKGKTQSEIGEENSVTSSTVSHYMKKHDIETNAHRVDDERLEDPEWLREKYEEEEMTMQQIADEVGCSDGTVMRRLHEVEGIDIRRSPIEEGEEAEGEEEPDDEDGDEAEESEGEEEPDDEDDSDEE